MLGCGGDDQTGPPEPVGAVLTIDATTAWPPAGLNGYAVTVDHAAALSLPLNGYITVAALTPGAHTVELSGMPAICALRGENPSTVEIVAGEPANVSFLVSCPALQISVSTTGSEPDTDGYEVRIDGEGWGSVPPNGTLMIPSLGPGPRSVALVGVAPNCVVSGGTPRIVEIPGAQGSSTHFDVVCSPAGTLLVDVFVTAGDPDPDGFVVTLNGGPRMGLDSPYEYVQPGDYTVVLSDIAPHCTLMGSNTARATVPQGGVGTISFSVTCGRLRAVSPGRDLVLDANSEIALLRADGSSFESLTNEPGYAYDASWSPDGRRIAYTSSLQVPVGPDPFSPLYYLAHVFVMNADGSGRTQLTNGDTPVQASGTAGERGAAWSPDGSRIAYIGTPPDSSSSIFVMNADGSGQTRLTGRGSIPYSGAPAWSPDGTRIVYADWSLDHPGIFVVHADGGGETRLTDGTDAGAAWSPDGNRIAFARFVLGRGSEVNVMNSDGTGLTPVASDTGGSHQDVSWSPDGTKLAFDLNGKIYLANADGTGLTQLTFGQPVADLPSWSPDGGRLAYLVHGDRGVAQLYRMNLDGSGEAPLSPSWSGGGPSAPAAWRP